MDLKKGKDSGRKGNRCGRVMVCLIIGLAVAFAWAGEDASAAHPFKKAKVKGVAAKDAGKGTVRVSWKKCSRASGYVVCVSRQSKGKYKKVKTLPKTSRRCRVGDLAIGKEYYFRVVPYKKVRGKRVYGRYSRAASCVLRPAPPRVDASSVDQTTGKIRITVGKSKGAKGYLILRARKKEGPYSKIKYLAADERTFVSGGLEANAWYFYRVRPYTVIRGKKVYGKYSTVFGDRTGGFAKRFDLSRIKPVDSPLRGKRILFLGSSITNGTLTGGKRVSFVDYLAKRDGVIAEKLAVGGTTMATVKEGSYVERIRQVAYDGRRDLIVCQLSTNDARYNVPVRIETGDEMSADGGDEDPSLRDPEAQDPKEMDPEEMLKDADTVRGAIDYIIVHANRELGCPVLFYAVPPFRTTPVFNAQVYNEMRTVLREARDYWSERGLSVYVMDMQDPGGYPSMAALATYDESRSFYMRDAVHPTSAGYYKKYLPVFENYLIHRVRW